MTSRLIFQYWFGEPSPLAEASMQNMERYASAIGVEHRRIEGKPVGEHLCEEIQKGVLFDTMFDEYEEVLELDCDVFSRATADVFQVKGVGLIGGWMNRPKQPATNPKCRWDFPYFNGGFLKMNRDLRIALRKHLTSELFECFNSRKSGGVEMLVHTLLVRAGLKPAGIPKEWNYYAHLRHPETAHFIHIRRGGAGKWAIYQNLVQKGILS